LIKLFSITVHYGTANAGDPSMLVANGVDGILLYSLFAEPEFVMLSGGSEVPETERKLLPYISFPLPAELPVMPFVVKVAKLLPVFITEELRIVLDETESLLSIHTPPPDPLLALLP
jgi:hypothetical protein